MIPATAVATSVRGEWTDCQPDRIIIPRHGQAARLAVFQVVARQLQKRAAVLMALLDLAAGGEAVPLPAPGYLSHLVRVSRTLDDTAQMLLRQQGGAR